MNKEEFPPVGVVIVNFKGYEDAIGCLESWKKSTYPNFKIAVADTASPDDSCARLEAAQKTRGDFTLLQAGWDGGFSAGANCGMKWAFASGMAYACLMDNDIEVEPGYLSALVETAQKDARVGMVGAKYLCFENRDVIQHAGGTYLPMLGYAWSHGRDKKDGPAYAREKEADWACGMLVSRAAVEKSGMWREDYFHFIDDIEWPMRMKRNGFKVVFQPKARLYHKGAGVHKGDPIHPYYYERRNAIYFLLDQFEWTSPFGIAARVSKMFIDAVLSPFTGKKYMPRLVMRILGDILKNRRGRVDLSEFKK